MGRTDVHGIYRKLYNGISIHARGLESPYKERRSKDDDIVVRDPVGRDAINGLY